MAAATDAVATFMGGPARTDGAAGVMLIAPFEFLTKSNKSVVAEVGVLTVARAGFVVVLLLLLLALALVLVAAAGGAVAVAAAFGRWQLRFVVILTGRLLPLLLMFELTKLL